MPSALTIGSDETCDFPIAFDVVSGRHCRLIFEDGEVLVEDLDSTNGTYVDGKQVPPGTRQRVESGAELSLGGETSLSWDDIQSLRPAPERGAGRRTPEPGPSSVMAGFLLRAVAALLDGVVLTVLMVLVGLTVLYSVTVAYNFLFEFGFSMAVPSPFEVLLFVLLSGWVYAAAFEASGFRATPGKLILGIEVTDEQGEVISFQTATGRHFGKILSTAILLVGFLMAGFTKKKQALHDVMVGCHVRKRTGALSIGQMPAWTPSLGFGGFWKRVAAALIDGLLLMLLSALIGFFVGVVLSAWYDVPMRANLTVEYVGQRLLFLGRIGTLTVGWLYFALFESSGYQATPGKQVLGMKVTGIEGKSVSFAKATGRHFGKFLSGAILSVGYLMAGFTEEKQALHDRMAGCLVVNE